MVGKASNPRLHRLSSSLYSASLALLYQVIQKSISVTMLTIEDVLQKVFARAKLLFGERLTSADLVIRTFLLHRSNIIPLGETLCF